MRTNKNVNITEYDLYGYNYEDYWKQNRVYENECDKLAVKQLIKNESGDWYVDLGGSYGRLLSTYNPKFLHNVLTDYSIESLKKAKKDIKDRKIANVDLVALNIYNLPFKDGSFSGGQMIRVMHHIEDPELCFKELSRIIKKRGFFILEFANKIHFLAKIRALIKLNPKFIFNKQPYKQPTKETKQGTKEEDGLFYNFHPKHIDRLINDNSFTLERRRSASNLRSGFFKSIFSNKTLIKFELLLQKALSFTSFGPSLYRKMRKTKGVDSSSCKSIYEIISCPKCKGALNKKASRLFCGECNTAFPITYGILDLRWPRPSNE